MSKKAKFEIFINVKHEDGPKDLSFYLDDTIKRYAQMVSDAVDDYFCRRPDPEQLLKLFEGKQSFYITINDYSDGRGWAEGDDE